MAVWLSYWEHPYGGPKCLKPLSVTMTLWTPLDLVMMWLLVQPASWQSCLTPFWSTSRLHLLYSIWCCEPVPPWACQQSQFYEQTLDHAIYFEVNITLWGAPVQEVILLRAAQARPILFSNCSWPALLSFDWIIYIKSRSRCFNNMTAFRDLIKQLPYYKPEAVHRMKGHKEPRPF